MVVAMAMAIAPEAADAFAAPSGGALARMFGAGRATAPLCSLRMQDDAGDDTAAEPVLNRKAKREAAKMGKKKGTGVTKQENQAKGGVRGKAGKSPIEGKLVEVALTSDFPEDGATKSVEIDNKPVMLLKCKGTIMASQVGCTKCKIPLMGAEIIESTIRCKLCGSSWKLPSGDVIEDSEGTIMSGLFSSTPQGKLAVFATKTMAGKVFLGVAK
eukprot:CAMPEP_0173381144 /NCGR_PEP_ID=MMETSP1356-20130122/3605_1 /TAXON_ID=77927 ORGANISM="Hemiselmis virescens, Strain PCC157" /NCGR_SAMPLE_ID=MMETSP1356 /ASSEMBLY_ACC=CAM_ASM_000847 /LENGTH=213 /DNA_ID=CAMNT_0014334895 /DNA_START=63 /DNA_END=704 /DNA_ORIENTATION=+